VCPAAVQDRCERTLPAKTAAKPKLLDQPRNDVIGTKEMVVELFQPDILAKSKPRGEAARHRLALIDDDLFTALE